MPALSRVIKDPQVLRELTDREYRFVHEYVVDLNATRAALDSGYSENGAQQTGHNLLKKTHVRAAIRYLEQKALKDCAITAQKVREKIAQILMFKPAMYFESGGEGGWYTDKEGLRRLPDWVHELIKEVQQRTIERADEVLTVYWVKLMDKDAALALAARYTLGIEQGPQQGDGKLKLPFPLEALRVRRAGEVPRISQEIARLEALKSEKTNVAERAKPTRPDDGPEADATVLPE